MATVNVVTPRATRETLDKVTNTYAVKVGEQWSYYTIRFGEPIVHGKYVQITKMPPVIAEGIVTYKKKHYRVTFEDFFRSRVNVQYEFIESRNASSQSDIGTGTDPGSAVPAPIRVVDKFQSGIGELIGDEDSQAADLAWDEQIRTLLYTDDQEEKWSIESTT